MKFQGLKQATLLLLLLVLGLPAFAQEVNIEPSGMVNDYANMLQPDEKRALEQKLMGYRDTTSTEIVVVTEKNLNGGDAFTRALSIARAWGIGQKDKNNGIILYIAFDDRKIELLTANKTQGAVVDHEAKRIITDVIRPNFRAKQYYTGIDQAINSLIRQFSGEFHGSPKKKNDSVWPAIITIFLIILFVVIFSRGNRYNRGYRGGGMYWFPTSNWGNWNSGGGGNDSGSGWGGFGGGGGFDGGGASGDW